MANIITVFDGKRGCGWRKEGGLYFMGGETSAPCGRMPWPLNVCRCCGQGIKPARGYTWVETSAFAPEGDCGAKWCGQCPLGGAPQRCGLLWIGGKYYQTPADFLSEANTSKLNGDPYGISRRITSGQIPKGFEIGKTMILLAHREAIPPAPEMGDDPTKQVAGPGIFAAFRPTRIEYVVKGDETEDELDRMEKRGITLVRVMRLGEQIPMEDADGMGEEE